MFATPELVFKNGEVVVKDGKVVKVVQGATRRAPDYDKSIEKPLNDYFDRYPPCAWSISSSPTRRSSTAMAAPSSCSRSAPANLEA